MRHPGASHGTGEDSPEDTHPFDAFGIRHFVMLRRNSGKTPACRLLASPDKGGDVPAFLGRDGALRCYCGASLA